jgi:hypothetical protein
MRLVNTRIDLCMNRHSHRLEHGRHAVYCSQGRMNENAVER